MTAPLSPWITVAECSTDLKTSPRRHPAASRVVDVTLLLLAVVGTCLHILGLVFPGWWYIDDPDNTGTSDVTYFGIWATVTCQNGTCVTSSSDRSGTRAWLQGVAVIETLAAVLLACDVATHLVLVRQDKTVSILRRLVVILTSGAGSIIIIGILLFVKKKAGLTPLEALETRDGTTGWPLLLSSVAAALSLLVAVVMGIGQLTMFAEEKDYDEEDKSVAYWQQKAQQLNDLK
ncbi:uncharacterized protein LOC117335892 [Pecten maximus]|uniref:uncharacterized protein LOC117335892 n=1 Tax=Pecten maximus TaxID=6579 RepID=UPI001458885D|nr:uncharacterized protein LOC117335892 [Pecten maximus]